MTQLKVAVLCRCHRCSAEDQLLLSLWAEVVSEAVMLSRQQLSHSIQFRASNAGGSGLWGRQLSGVSRVCLMNRQLRHR